MPSESTSFETTERFLHVSLHEFDFHRYHYDYDIRFRGLTGRLSGWELKMTRFYHEVLCVEDLFMCETVGLHFYLVVTSVAEVFVLLIGQFTLHFAGYGQGLMR